MKLLVYLAFSVAFMPSVAQATTQRTDQVIIDGERHYLIGEPLTQFLTESDKYATLAPYFDNVICSGSHRRHIAVWRIEGNKLQLEKVLANPCEHVPKEVPIAEIFPEREAPVVANWFTGRLVVPIETANVKPGYFGNYQLFLTLTVEKGIVLRREESKVRPK